MYLKGDNMKTLKILKILTVVLLVTTGDVKMLLGAILLVLIL